MDLQSDIAIIAVHLVEQHGRRAAAVAETLAVDHVAVGDGEGAAFWSRVERAVHAMEAAGKQAQRA